MRASCRLNQDIHNNNYLGNPFVKLAEVGEGERASHLVQGQLKRLEAIDYPPGPRSAVGSLVLTAPDGVGSAHAVVVSFKAEAAIVTVSNFEELPAKFRTVTTKEEVPTWTGMPVITPAELRVSPLGRLPLERDHC